MTNNEQWIKCTKCGHKLFKILPINDQKGTVKLEIKCHSCKQINEIELINDEKSPLIEH